MRRASFHRNEEEKGKRMRGLNGHLLISNDMRDSEVNSGAVNEREQTDSENDENRADTKR